MIRKYLSLMMGCVFLLFCACESKKINMKPDFVHGEIIKKRYEGDLKYDLLTGGFAIEGLTNPNAPQLSNPHSPDEEELRAKTIYHNYRALQDNSLGGGYGIFYGPGVKKFSSGKVAGKEYLAYADDGSGRQNVTMMVQIPSSFDPENPCIIAAPSSGSRGVYGAIGTAGEWGLNHGCAVVYTDKGTGVGVHDLNSETVSTITGIREKAKDAGKRSNFTVQTSDKEQLEKLKKTNPYALAVKHAHSRQNAEKSWGQDVLNSIEFAFYILNLEENFGAPSGKRGTLATIRPENTIVIASSISNGGGASIRAAEIDRKNLIDGVAVAEPNITPEPDKSLVIQQGDKTWNYPNHSRNIVDYYTYLYLFQPCANLAPENSEAPLNLNVGKSAENRCKCLAEKGLVRGQGIKMQATDAQKRINDYGILTEQNYLMPSHDAFSTIESIAYTFTNQYGKFSVFDNLCDYSFAPVYDDKNAPASLKTEDAAAMFAVINAIPPASINYPVSRIGLINNNSKGGPRPTRTSYNSEEEMDQNFQGALALRRVVTGKDINGNPVNGKELEMHERVRKGISESRATGNLHGTPTVYVTGRSDAVIAPNHASRPYFGLNKTVEGKRSNLYYYEVLNAHHLDTFNQNPKFGEKYISLHYYYTEAVNLMYDHLKNGKPLPPSQVIRTIPRGNVNDVVPPVTLKNLPAIDHNPDDKNRIRFLNGTTVYIPD